MTVAYFMRFGGFWRYPMVLDSQNNPFMLGLVIQAAFGFPMFPILHGLDTFFHVNTCNRGRNCSIPQLSFPWAHGPP
jgi:hypothetical protein